MRTNGSNTKTKIFDTAIRMFAADGYDNVPLRTIADAVGIKAASIYNHYGSKQQLLTACYRFYIEHRHDARLNKEQYEPILRNGTKEEVMQVINYPFADDVFESMVCSLLVIFSRISIDEDARNIYADEINTSMRYLMEFFNTGIEVGRLHTFTIRPVSYIILSSRLFAAQSVTLKPEQTSEWRKSELEIFDELLNIIPCKY